MKILAIVLIAIVAAWHGASWKAAMLTEEEEQAISVGLKNIANTSRRRSCIFQAEINGLSQINSVLVKHGSEYRIYDDPGGNIYDSWNLYRALPGARFNFRLPIRYTWKPRI